MIIIFGRSNQMTEDRGQKTDDRGQTTDGNSEPLALVI